MTQDDPYRYFDGRRWLRWSGGSWVPDATAGPSPAPEVPTAGRAVYDPQTPSPTLPTPAAPGPTVPVPSGPGRAAPDQTTTAQAAPDQTTTAQAAPGQTTAAPAAPGQTTAAQAAPPTDRWSPPSAPPGATTGWPPSAAGTPGGGTSWTPATGPLPGLTFGHPQAAPSGPSAEFEGRPPRHKVRSVALALLGPAVLIGAAGYFLTTRSAGPAADTTAGGTPVAGAALAPGGPGSVGAANSNGTATASATGAAADASPTDAPTGTPTGPAAGRLSTARLTASGVSLTYAGRGNRVIKLIGPSAAVPLLVTITHGGPGGFTVSKLSGAGRATATTSTLVRATGAYTGTVPLDIAQGDTTGALTVQATGAWTIRLRSATDAPTWNAAGALLGRGDQVYLVRNAGGAGNGVTVVHGGAGAIVLDAWGGISGDQTLVDAAGPYTGHAVIPQDAVLLVVRADGPWRLAKP
jgi:hypothetical protein